MSEVRIVHASDTHMMLNAQMVYDQFPEADIFIHTGDFTNLGKPEEFQHFNELLGQISAKYEYRVVIVGNHDCYVFGDRFYDMAAFLSNATHILIYDKVNIKGITIYGSPWWHGHNWHYGLNSKSLNGSARFDEIPEHLDILLTHGPPLNILDEADGISGNYSGSEELREVLKIVKPKVHLFGHIHEQYGVTTHDGTLYVNSAMKNRWGEHRLEHPAHLLIARKENNGEWKFNVAN